mgnify:CR=1 FL=1
MVPDLPVSSGKGAVLAFPVLAAQGQKGGDPHTGIEHSIPDRPFPLAMADRVEYNAAKNAR